MFKYLILKYVILKYVILLLFVLLCSSMVLAQTYTGGQPIDLYNIERCEGPVNVKVNPELKYNPNNIDVMGCNQTSNKTWKCNCNNVLKLKVDTKNKTRNTYEFVIQYFIEYSEVENNSNQNDSNRTPSMSEIQLENNKRIKRVDNIIVEPYKKSIFSMNLDENIKKILIFVVIIFIFVLILVFFIVKFAFKNTKKGDTDVLNYSVKKENNENSDNVNDKLNKIK